MGRKKVDGVRIESVKASDFSPLTASDLKTIRTFIVGPGPIFIERRLLARLVLDRERLLYVIEATRLMRGLFEQADNIDSGKDEDFLEGDTQDLRMRGVGVVLHALGQLEGAGDAGIVSPVTTLRILFKQKGK